MSEFKAEVKNFILTYSCDECKVGEMKPTGIVLTSNPPQYPHVCDKCGSQKTFWQRYPVFTYEVVK